MYCAVPFPARAETFYNIIMSIFRIHLMHIFINKAPDFTDGKVYNKSRCQ